MEINQQSVNVLEIVLSASVVVLPALISLIATLAGVTRLAVGMRMFWRAIRPAMDDPQDAIVKLIAQRTGQSEAWVIKNLVEKLDQITGIVVAK